jgi:hypothetical protein
MPDAGGTLNTATFSEVDAHTMLTLLSLCPSREVRDGIIDAGWKAACRSRRTLWSSLRSRWAESLEGPSGAGVHRDRPRHSARIVEAQQDPPRLLRHPLPFRE